eukprot:SAG31_NODE_722_length_12572_cov_2.409124_7_plen_156_part_00
MFIVLGIGLDGVFLITDHFDMEPAVSASSGSRRLPRERVISAVTKAGPSVLIASTTDVLAFMSCVFTPVPVIRYFCMTVSIALLICLCLLFTWYISWLDRLTSAHEDKMIANKLAEVCEVPSLLLLLRVRLQWRYFSMIVVSRHAVFIVAHATGS